MMVGKLSELNTIYTVKLQSTAGALSQYVESSVANYMGQTMLYKQLIQQSTLWAFIDSFRIFGLMCFIIIPLLLFIKSNKSLYEKK